MEEPEKGWPGKWENSQANVVPRKASEDGTSGRQSRLCQMMLIGQLRGGLKCDHWLMCSATASASSPGRRVSFSRRLFPARPQRELGVSL